MAQEEGGEASRWILFPGFGWGLEARMGTRSRRVAEEVILAEGKEM